jgi:hypothetical protein
MVSHLPRMFGVGIETIYGLECLGSILGRGKRCSLLHSGSRAHTTSYPMSTGAGSPEVKASEA